MSVARADLTCLACGRVFPFAISTKTGDPAETCSRPCRSRLYYIRNVKGDRPDRKFRRRSISYQQRREREQRLKLAAKPVPRPPLTAEERKRRRAAAQKRYKLSAKGQAMLARFFERHPNYDHHRHLRRYKPVIPWEGLPMAYVGHDLFEEARRLTGITGDSMAAQDLLGVAVLALIEGKDPREEVRHLRAMEAGWQRVQASYITNIEGLGLDGHGNVISEYQEESA